jgi:hypothetical protein
MTWISLGSRYALATPDTTGNNPGRWTSLFDAALLGILVPTAQVYHAVAEQVPPGAAGTVSVGNRHYSFTFPLGGSEWDPVQPLLIEPGQDLMIYWSAAATGTPPAVTVWLRYDSDLLIPRGYR